MGKYIYKIYLLLLLLPMTAKSQDMDSIKTKIVESFRGEDFEQCLSYSGELLRMAAAENDTFNMTQAYYYLGFANQKSGNMEDGLKYGTLCYDLATAINDSILISSSLNNIGNIYLVNKEDSLAIVYFTQSLEIERMLGNIKNQGTRLGNISSAYRELKDYENALNYAKQGLEIDLKVGRKDKIAVRYNQLGNIYTEIDDFTEAIDCQTNAYDYFESVGSNYGMCVTTFAIGQVYDKLNDYMKCKHYYMQSLNYAEKIHNHLMIEKIYKQLYLCSRDIDPTFSLKYHELYTAMKDSVFTAENQRLLQEFHAKYEIREKEIEIERQNAEIHEAKKEFYITIVVAILLIIIIILLVIQVKAVKNKQVLLEKINTTKDRMLSIISHDLKNPATAERNVLCQLRHCHSSMPEKNIDDILDHIIESSESQIDLINNLLEWTRIQVGKTEFTPINFDLTKCIKDTIALFDNQLAMKKININFNADEKKMAFSDINIIATTARNLISNAVKFSNEGGDIDIEIADFSTDKFLVSVKDHGIGMTEELIRKLLSKDKIGTLQGTQGERGNGLGLNICKELLGICKETYNVESQEGKGSIFSFTVRKSAN